jgi:hypothetical protein
VLKKRSPLEPLSGSRATPGYRVVDQEFIGVRSKLIEVAAFLDRVERYGATTDFRCEALRKAAALLTDGQVERARRVLELLSDPTTEPEATSSQKAALGAWQPPTANASTGK